MCFCGVTRSFQKLFTSNKKKSHSLSSHLFPTSRQAAFGVQINICIILVIIRSIFLRFSLSLALFVFFFCTLHELMYNAMKFCIPSLSLLPHGVNFYLKIIQSAFWREQEEDHIFQNLLDVPLALFFRWNFEIYHTALITRGIFNKIYIYLISCSIQHFLD